MMAWILLGLAAFLALVWGWEWLDTRRRKNQEM